MACGVAAVAAWQAGLASEDAPGPGAAAGGAHDQAIRYWLGLARRLEPGNPRHAEQLALHLELLASQAPPRPERAREYLMQARALYLETARVRPTWPLALTSLLRTDFKLRRFGSPFTRLYARAAAVGRSEPVALRALVDLGLAAWPVLDPDGQREVVELLRHGLKLDPQPLLERAVRLRRGALVEPLVAADPGLVRLYEDLRARAAGLR